jgi:hypothetical protein
VRAPRNAGTGFAKVTLLFEGWKKGKIQPVVVEVPVNHVPPKRAAAPNRAAALERIRPLERELLDLSSLARANLGRARGKGPVPRVPVNTCYNVERFAPVTARFVRFTILATADGHEPALDELEVYGPDGPVNLASAKGARATASSLLPGFAAHKVHHLNDGKYGNDWSWVSRHKQGWAQIELPAPAKVCRVVWCRDANAPPRSGDRLASDYKVEVSEDGHDWKTVATGKDRVAVGKETWLSRAALRAALAPDQQKRHRQLVDELKRLNAGW